MMKVSILLILFIFAMVAPASSDSDKSRNATANQVTTIKMDENNGIIQKKGIPAKKLLTMKGKQPLSFLSDVAE